MTYEEFINPLIARNLRYVPKSGLCRHHIVPRCLGGSDESNNIVVLTDAEHFTAHVLLAKENPDNVYLQSAVLLMSKFNSLDEEGYSQARANFAKLQSSRQSKVATKLWQDPEYRTKVVSANSGKKRSEEFRAKCRTKTGIASPMYGKKHSEAARDKMSRSKLGQAKSEECKDAMSRSAKTRSPRHHFNISFSKAQNRGQHLVVFFEGEARDLNRHTAFLLAQIGGLKFSDLLSFAKSKSPIGPMSFTLR